MGLLISLSFPSVERTSLMTCISCLRNPLCRESKSVCMTVESYHAQKSSLHVLSASRHPALRLFSALFSVTVTESCTWLHQCLIYSKYLGRLYFFIQPLTSENPLTETGNYRLTDTNSSLKLLLLRMAVWWEHHVHWAAGLPHWEIQLPNHRLLTVNSFLSVNNKSYQTAVGFPLPLLD